MTARWHHYLQPGLRMLAGIVFGSSLALPAASAQSVDTIVVFDGSNSMWGQIDGQAKIEIARDTLSSVLSETTEDMQIGLIAYGHRQRGVCSDIETLVSVGPARQTVPAIINAANGITPRGKTPLTDAVRKAAEELRYTENAATVVLVTDGIETCNADPCALGAELERSGINFTAHVVGFGLSAEEGRQVQCLAENTGGLYIPAGDAGALRDALQQTVTREIDASEDDFGPAEQTVRNVRFILRDTPEGPQIGFRQLTGTVETETGEPVGEDAFEFAYPEGHGASANASLAPGRYVGLFHRDGGNQGGYDARFEFVVPEGTGEHVIEASLSGTLVIKPYINPNMPIIKGEPFPTAVGGSRPRVNFAVYPVVGGSKAEEPIATGNMINLTFPLSPGTYLVQGNLDSGPSVERLVDVKAGAVTEFDFSFDATRVFVDAREAGGAPVKRQTTYWYDGVPGGQDYWLKGGGAGGERLTPFYMPAGQWGLNVGGEGYGERRSDVMVEVPGTYQDMTIKVGEGERLSPGDANLLKNREPVCLEFLQVKYSGCLTKRAEFPSDEQTGPETDQQSVLPQPSNEDASAADNESVDAPSRIAFNNRSTGRSSAGIERDADGKVTMTLMDGWCGEADCRGNSFPVEATVMSAIEAGDRQTFTVDGLIEIHTAPAGFADMLTVVFDPAAPRPIKGVMVKAEEQARAEQAVEMPPSDAAPVDPYALGTTLRIADLDVPFGIYAAVDGVDSVASARPKAQEFCRKTPTVIEAGGSMRMKELDAASGSYKQIMYSECSSWEGADNVVCTISRGTPEFPDPFSSIPPPQYEALGDGHFRGCIDRGGQKSCQIFYACVRPGGPLSVEQKLPSGERTVDAIVKSYNGKSPGYRYVDDASFVIEERQR